MTEQSVIIMAPKRVDSEEKRAQILAAARDVIAAHGFESTKISWIAEKAGIGKGTIYEYFPSKEVIFDQLIERELTNLASMLDEFNQMDMRSLWTAFPAMIPEMAADEVGNRFMFQIWFQSSLDFNTRYHGMLRDFYERSLEMFAGLIKKSQSEGVVGNRQDAAELARMLSAFLDGIFVQGLVFPELLQKERLQSFLYGWLMIDESPGGDANE